MPDLKLSILGVAPVVHGLSPMLRFQVRVCAAPSDTIQAVILQCQIQLQPARRSYSPSERSRLSELFGALSEWGRTLRNRLWAHSSAILGQFTGSSDASLLVPCTYDLNLAATKYFHALEGEEIPLLFLFSGSVFYLHADGRLQVQPISWDQEAEYRMPLRLWQQALEYHYPNTAWLQLRRDIFDRLADYRRSLGALTWEQTVESLLAAQPVETASTAVREVSV